MCHVQCLVDAQVHSFTFLIPHLIFRELLFDPEALWVTIGLIIEIGNLIWCPGRRQTTALIVLHKNLQWHLFLRNSFSDYLLVIRPDSGGSTLWTKFQVHFLWRLSRCWHQEVQDFCWLPKDEMPVQKEEDIILKAPFRLTCSL